MPEWSGDEYGQAVLVIPINPATASPLTWALILTLVISSWGMGASAGAETALADESIEPALDNMTISTFGKAVVNVSKNETAVEDKRLVRDVWAIYRPFFGLVMAPMRQGMVWGYTYPNTAWWVGPMVAWGPFAAWAYVFYKGLKRALWWT